MKNFAPQQVMTGSHGQVWIDGDLVAEVTAFKANIKLSKEEVKKAKEWMLGKMREGGFI